MQNKKYDQITLKAHKKSTYFKYWKVQHPNVSQNAR